MNHIGRTFLWFVLFCISLFVSAGVLWAYPGDINGNGTVEWDDLAIIASNWLASDCNNLPSGNLDNDCDVDLNDYAILAKDWLKTTPKSITYHVVNLNDSGPGSFADCLAQAEADGKDSVILFDVGGTISRTSGRFNIYEPNLIVCGTTAPNPGITFDLNEISQGFRVYASRVQFADIRMINTVTNSDGITLMGASNCIVERCSFYLCRDEGVGITDSTARNNTVAFSRFEYCGSQSDPYSDGRGILITYDASATLVGNYVYHCNRGITINGAKGFMDSRNNKVEYSLSPASGAGITNAGSKSNVINCEANYNATSGFKCRKSAIYYRSGNIGTGNATYFEAYDADCTEVFEPIVIGDTPFPYWLEDASTPVDANGVGMRTGIPHCLKAIDPNPANKKVGVNASVVLGWKPSQVDAGTHDVYFGTDFVSVSDANQSSPEYKGNFSYTSFTPGMLETDVTYYWRVDEVGNYGTWKGDTWRFSTVLLTQASEPNPAGGTIDVDMNADLSWQPGVDANSHDVYFGTNFAAVLNANHSSQQFKGNQTANSFDPGLLLYWVTYYWRVDEVNSVGGIVKGTVWNFTTVKDPTMPAADYYVDPNGNDSNPGTTIALAWKTIQKAANIMTAGQTVLVMPGTYAEQVTAATDGTDGNSITFRAWHEKGPVIINATGKSLGLKSTAAYVTFDGFEVKNANGNGVLVSGDSADYNIVKNCRVYNNGGDGVKIDSADYCIVRNCLIYDNAANGMELVSNGEPTTIVNCTIHSNNNGDGIHTANCDGTVTDCIITSNTAWGIDSYGTLILNVIYSDIWGNTSGHYDDVTKIIQGSGTIHLDPLFVNPAGGDFHLQSGSPCKNAASDGGDIGYRYGTP